MKKGQTALEYLMTYGWAIIIVVVVGAALWSMGVFNPSTFTGNTKSGFQDLMIEDWAVKADGTVTMSVGYRESGTAIEILGANITDADCGLSGTDFTPNDQDSVGIAAGDTETVTFNYSATDVSSGDDCDVEMIIGYNDTESGIVHSTSGTFRTKLE